ncbi:MAG: pentapeptide repeat-containing protein [Sandaracinus sp.]
MSGDARAHVLAGTSFEGERFEGLDLAGADLAGKDFARCVFVRCKLGETRWRSARLEDVEMDACDLTRAKVEGLALRGARFTRSKLMGVDWSGVSDFPDVAFAESSLEYAMFVGLSLRKLSLDRCNLRHASFVRVDLQKARFDGSELEGARFEDCDLRGASLAGTRGALVDPRQNRVQGVVIPEEAALALADLFGMKVRR